MKIAENENIIRKFKKNDFDDLNNVIEKEDDYNSTEYEIDEEKI